MDQISPRLIDIVRTFASGGPQTWVRTPDKDSPRYMRYTLPCGAMIRAETSLRTRVQVCGDTVGPTVPMPDIWHVEVVLPTSTPGSLAAWSLGEFPRTSTDPVQDILDAMGQPKPVEQARRALTALCLAQGATQRAVYWMPEHAAVYDPLSRTSLPIDPELSEKIATSVAPFVYFEGSVVFEALQDALAAGHTLDPNPPWTSPFVPCAQGMFLQLPKTRKKRARALRQAHADLAPYAGAVELPTEALAEHTYL